METPEIKLPQVDVNIYRNKKPVEIPIVESFICTESASPNFIRHITFDVSGTELEGKVRAGQSIGIIPPGENEKGRPHQLRLYSVSSPSLGEDGEGKLVSTTVKRVIDEHWETQELFTGICSNYLASRKVGETVQMTGPSGKYFLVPENHEDFNYVFFATGTGIAPFRGMAKDLAGAGSKSQVVIILGVPYRTDLMYRKEFEALANEFENIHFITCVSRELPNPDGSRNYVQTKINTHSDLLLPILEQDNTLIYICGMKGMDMGIYQELHKKGLTGYTELKGEAAVKPVAEWTREDIKLGVRPSKRVFVEVY